MASLKALFDQALQAERGGDWQLAEAIYRDVIAREPDRFAAQNNLGNLLARAGRSADALACFHEALRLNPNLLATHVNLGNLQLDLGNVALARSSFERALQLDGNSAAALVGLGRILLDTGQNEAALQTFHRAAQLEPDSPAVHCSLGTALHDLRRFDEAAASLERAIGLQPNLAAAHYNLGRTLFSQGKLAAAQHSCEEALRLKPDYVLAHNNLGVVLKQMHRLADARASFERALTLDPECAQAHHNLGIVLQYLGDVPAAISCFEAAVACKPDYADAHGSLAMAYLLSGDFKRGWPEYEWRFRSSCPADFPTDRPRWNGSPLAGRSILLCAEQALGDTLQFVRYAPLVKQLGGHVVLECQPALVPLLSSGQGIDRIVGQGSERPPTDVYAPLLSLPALLGTTLTTVPNEAPYLRTDRELVERWRARLDAVPGFRIGIAWQGSPRNPSWWRNIGLEHFAHLAPISGVKLISLQKDGGAQIRRLKQPFPILDFSDELDVAGAFLDTAAIMQQLDLVVTSDTAIAHLAGGLGVRTWVALPTIVEWRWLLERDDSPWYPTLRLFRQRQAGDWAGVFERMAASLKALLG